MSDVLVLCYHAISERWPAPLSVTPRQLESQIAFLAARGYRGATFIETVLSPPTAKTVAVTFDDAYRSVIKLALPILSRYGLPATVFVPTRFAGTKAPMAWPGIEDWLGTPYESELTPMSWEELDTLAEEGWEIGSHTRSHPRLTQLSDAALVDELLGSRRDCESGLQRPCKSLAYPYGDEDERVIEAARDAGYSAAGTLPARLTPPRVMRWPRVGIYHVDHRLRFSLKASQAVRRLRASPMWPRR